MPVSSKVYRIILCCYFGSVLVLTLGTRFANSETQINLNPFRASFVIAQSGIKGFEMGGISGMVKHLLWYQEVIIKAELNIILFIPLGALVPLNNSLFHNVWKVIIVGLGFSFMIEIAQLVFRLGWFDTEDLLYNTIGTLLGSGMYIIVFIDGFSEINCSQGRCKQ